MMNIAIIGASSKIAKDLTLSLFKHTDYHCTLFVRNLPEFNSWLSNSSLLKSKYRALDYSNFSNEESYDVIINFVGVGDPVKAQKMGSDIFDITQQFDLMVLNYLKDHNDTKYLFLSSGAVYGDVFTQPVEQDTPTLIPINNLSSTNWYSIAKLYAEARHRALKNYSIVDIRVFNYYSHTQDINTRFLITDIVRALKNNTVLSTSADDIYRDFITPIDFFNLIQAIIFSKNINMPVDCYTKSPVGKFELLSAMEKKFGLKYHISEKNQGLNVTGNKKNYYSLNKVAHRFGYKPFYNSIDGISNEIHLLGL